MLVIRGVASNQKDVEGTYKGVQFVLKYNQITQGKKKTKYHHISQKLVCTLKYVCNACHRQIHNC